MTVTPIESQPEATDLATLIADLRAEVAALRDEVASLQGSNRAVVSTDLQVASAVEVVGAPAVEIIPGEGRGDRARRRAAQDNTI